ncbi:adenylyl-sulfate kinase [Massilia solisilvae]|uniref:Adenylyl-sulfate kinase n=1 Tax=Massilia solisilvae TaxID=1811225 RepID=A0ABT2BED2_9BURK|nr:adenylyl-sulfate kinase [Massilia solisilvae]MCS0606800.1 adenylyl-sulfate kinase [Massilia solisilvae]
MVSTNVTRQDSAVSRLDRERLQRHRGAVLWLTGLSGAGKSTLANAVEARLHALGCRTFLLDGDNVRSGLCGDLGFSLADRHENIRRVGEAARLFLDAGVIVLCAFISPLKEDRQRARALAPDGDFVEIYCKSPLAVCERRDVKGLYRRARAGEIADFTGITSPYEEPDNPELVLDTARRSVDECADAVVARLVAQGTVPVSLQTA